ncbi:MAG: DUF222 domain-containing protein, partial [Jatrophihabitans sp.]|uniref:HNH endonuclease signature motif containing protein n=1 Tax=Jatrophihabitans sp. TaxID=1932789 RepID=UPI003F7FF93E
QVGLARMCSPHTAARMVGWSRVLVSELPHTYAALQAGTTTEWRAMIVARETAWLSCEDRLAVDAALAGKLARWGDRRVEKEAKKAAYRLDPRGAIDRTNRAAADRRVSIRPTPETMAVVSIIAPVAQGVAAYAALTKHADALVGAGDGRSRGQVMCDTAIERLTGQACADGVPVEINLIMTDQTLFGRGGGCEQHADPEPDPDRDVSAAAPTTTDVEETAEADVPARERVARASGSAGVDEPAHLLGFGPVPAPLARELVLGPDPTVPRWVRRLYTRPGSSDLLTMDTHRREFTPGMRRFLELRDQTCRTPFCDAPIRHADHVRRHTDGGPTSVGNGQGTCAACNYATEAPGWSKTADGDRITLRTPTGAEYTSRPPDPPEHAPPPPPPPHRQSWHERVDLVYLGHHHAA